LDTLCDWLQQEEEMKNKVTQFALSAMLVTGFAAPALAQNTNWKLNSEHSAGRLSVASTADPNAVFDAGIARVKGSVRLNAGSPAHSWFDFTIYPADQGPASINEDGSLNAAEFSNVPRSTVINFRSKQVTLTGKGDLAVTGDLTLSHLERPYLVTYSEAYGGPVYGEPEVRSATREVPQRNYLFTYDGKQYGALLNVEKAIAVYTRGSRFLEGTPIPPSRFDYQATYLDFWLKLVGVRDLRSVIVDNAWNRDRQESEVSLAKGKATLNQLVEWFLN
jgi:polyisoprenoid-binding protein YceI